MGFVHDLETAYTAHASAKNAVTMEKYMKNHFTFYGLKTELRRKLHKAAFEQNNKEVKANARHIALQLYAHNEREYHYSGIEILIKELKNNFTREDIGLIEHLIINNSWWDTVDTIAKYLLGGYLAQFPEERQTVIEKFSASDNLWLNRSALLFQLGYKKETNEKLLFSECKSES
jgi:3-methyladenine DNA glycosylase AlkD